MDRTEVGFNACRSKFEATHRDRYRCANKTAIAFSLVAHFAIILILAIQISLDTASAAGTPLPESFVLSVDMYDDGADSNFYASETVDVEQTEAIAALPSETPVVIAVDTQVESATTDTTTPVLPDRTTAQKKIPSQRPSRPTHAQPSQTSSAGISHPVTTLPITQANYLKNPRPPYPRQSRRLGEQGTVLLAVQIDTDGTAADVRVNSSSGYTRLDQLALTTVRAWHFVPGKKAGVPQKMWVHIPIDFILE